MMLRPVRDIVIVGGGTAGWMSAAAMSKLLGESCRIRLVESDEIGTIGVGEATIPHINEFNRALGIDEDEFLRATGGTFKLGVEFVNWGAPGQRYIHGFGRVGQPGGALPFHHFWLRMRALGKASPLEAYSMNTAAPRQAKFMRATTDMAGSPMQDLVHAFHFDASLYARYLRRYAEQRGVRRTEGKIARVEQRADGFIDAVLLENGERIGGDFFIDCSGMRALLIGQALGAPLEDWSHWLPCDRALAVGCESAGPLLPLTRVTAHSAGWQWRIPLQHRTGNGHVYSSRFMEQSQASAILMENLDGAALGEPRLIRFQPGRRVDSWRRNCVAVGLAGGFLEPLESTSIHLIQTAISRIANFFPHAGFDAADIAEYNRLTQMEYEHIRDFLILHYKATARTDSPFWDYCRTMPVPDTLQRKMDLFASNGRVYREQDELFTEMSWLQVMIGQGIIPRAYHPFADLRPEAEVEAYVAGTEQVIARCVKAMPTQAEFIAAHCAAQR
jgi:tryptophan 7-halogenase